MSEQPRSELEKRRAEQMSRNKEAFDKIMTKEPSRVPSTPDLLAPATPAPASATPSEPAHDSAGPVPTGAKSKAGKGTRRGSGGGGGKAKRRKPASVDPAEVAVGWLAGHQAEQADV